MKDPGGKTGGEATPPVGRNESGSCLDMLIAIVSRGLDLINVQRCRSALLMTMFCTRQKTGERFGLSGVR